MRWERKGLVFGPHGQHPWLRSHAQMPVAYELDDQRQRVFFASRDDANRSHVGWVDVELDGDPSAGEPPECPALAPGPLGNFDDHGVYPASLVEIDGRLLLYYIGWSPGVRAPLFYASIGLAESDDGGASFRRVSAAPIVARSEHDPCLVTSPCVRLEGSTWRMWYVSGFRWEERAGTLESWYQVKYAESEDGVSWRRDGVVCIGLREGERNIARPCVLRDGERYRMWYSRSGDQGYRLGYAESEDGLSWKRLDDEAGLEPSARGWDSDAVAYPWVLRLGTRWWMLYNGNGYGRDGFGAAVSA